MMLILAWIVAIVCLSFLWLRLAARWRREWDAYLIAEREWLERVDRGEFGNDAAAMNAAHPRK